MSELRLDRGEVDLAQRVPEADTDPCTEVGLVGAALNRMLDHVGHALEARHHSEMRVRQFVADAGHELRTPLAAIRGYPELSRRSRRPVPDEVGHVLRRVESAATAGQALIRVTDAGPGIPAELLPHVFERFARGDSSRSRAAGSTGLGLSIVYAVVTAHGGTVSVDSEPGRTEFTVRLPHQP